MCALFAALIIVGTYIKIPIPPVPVTLQTMFVLLAGLTLGAKAGLAGVGLYTLLGLVGLPVFTGGAGGIGYALTPTFGYIIGFNIAAFVSGLMTAGTPSYKRTLAASFVGMAVIYACGMLYYYLIQTLYMKNGVDFHKFILSFFLLPLPKDIVTCFVCATIAKRLKKIV